MQEPEPLHGIIVSDDADLGGQLVAVQSRPPLEIFTAPGVVEAIIDAVSTLARKDAPSDVTTDKGRKAIASHAFKVTKTKTYLDTLGKDEVARLKELPRQIDAARKAFRDSMDALALEIRQPLTDWEAIQNQTKRRLSILRNTPGDLMTSRADSVAIQSSIEAVEAQPTTAAEWGDFASDAASVKMLVLGELAQMLEDAKKREAEAAELERLRKEKAERDRLDREEQLRREGEARALATQQTAANTTTATATAPQASVSPEASVEHGAATTGAQSAAHPEAQGAGEPQSPAPIPTTSPAAQQLTSDVEHRRAYNREALADLITAMQSDGHPGPVPAMEAEMVLRAIVKGQIRHVSINY